MIYSSNILSIPYRRWKAGGRHGRGDRTLPLSVVAANNFDSTGISGDCKRACVVVHASAYMCSATVLVIAWRGKYRRGSAGVLRIFGNSRETHGPGFSALAERFPAL